MIHKELDKLLKNRTDFMGKIYPYYRRGYDSTKIARKLGHKSPTTITIFSTALDYLYGKKAIDYSMWKSVEQLEYRLKEWNKETHSPELTAHFHKLTEECAKRGDKSIFYVEEQASASYPTSTTVQQQVHKSQPVAIEAGVYVYSYPQYLLSEAFDQDNRTLYKIGASGNVDKRIGRQSRQTEVPEDLITIRKFLTPDAFDIERHFHNILIAAGHHHKTTSGGVEWFRTNLDTIDAIATALSLENTHAIALR